MLKKVASAKKLKNIPDIVPGTINATSVYCRLPVRDNSLKLKIVTGVFYGLAVVTTILQVLTRLLPFESQFGWDDGMIILVAVRRGNS